MASALYGVALDKKRFRFTLDIRTFLRPSVGQFLALFLSHNACAEISTDGTVGPAFSLDGPDYQVTADLGQQMGGNLFHSFSTFNINAGESATFSGPNTVNNIIGRVTGGDPSHINGLLRSTIPGADLYLLNPYGVLFGDNASLDIGGSFYASTADYLKLGDSGRFDASDPSNTILTTAPPSAFGILGSDPASLSAKDSVLQVKDGKELALVGGDINIADSNLYAPDGRVALASVSSPGEVPVDVANLHPGDFESMGNISVSNPSGDFPFIGLGEVGNLDVTSAVPGDAAGGGRIVIRGGHFQVKDGLLRAEVFENTAGGGIDVEVTGDAALSGDTRVLTNTFIFDGDAGPVSINAGTLNMADDATLSSGSAGNGSGGAITVTADSVTMNDRTAIKADATAPGSGGSVSVSTASLTMSDDAVIKTSSYGDLATGDAGDISVNADAIAMSGDATINSSSELGSQGQGGQVTVQANSLQMNQAAWIISFTETSRDAGEIGIDTGELAMADQSVISTTTFASGNGGTITIDSDQLALQDDAIITSGTEGSGNAGDVIINAGNFTATDNATLSSESEGGNFFVRNDPDLTDATGGGDGGLVRLVSAGAIDLSGNAVVASGTAGAGAGGNVELTAGNLNLHPSSGISAVSTGSGDAGNIGIMTGKSVNLDKGYIRTRAVTSDGGNIAISAPDRVYLRDSEITTSVESGFGNGGNITIDPEFVILNNSRIVANAYGGNGGNILIVTDNFIASMDSVVDASSRFGLDGTVIIRSPDADLSSSITDLPESFLDVAALLREPCAARRSLNRSSFIVRGRDAIPPGPMTSLPLASMPLNVSLDTGATGQSIPAVTTTPAAGVALTGFSDLDPVMGGLIDCAL